jgi:heat shock protein HtpX
VKNNLKTAAILAGLGALCMVIGGALGGNQGVVIGLVIGLVVTGISYWSSDKIAIASARGKPVTEAEMPQYYAIVSELARLDNVPMPKLYVSPSPQPNAFATGRNPAHSAVCINQGILQYLDWDELRGVLAHEMSHVRNRDILTTSVAAGVAMGIMFAARMAMFGALFGGGGNNRDREGGALGGLLMVILAPIAATFLQMALSRSREYEADASAARLLGTGEPLARALEKLEIGATRTPVDLNPAQAQAYIVNPLHRGDRQGGGARNLFSTHPPTADRIARLRSGEWR